MIRKDCKTPGNAHEPKAACSEDDHSMSIRDVLVSDMVHEEKAIRATTLEAYHQQKLRQFGTEKQSIQHLKKELASLESKLENLPESATFTDEWLASGLPKYVQLFVGAGYPGKRYAAFALASAL